MPIDNFTKKTKTASEALAGMLFFTPDFTDKYTSVDSVLKAKIPTYDKERILKNKKWIPNDAVIVRKAGEDYIDSPTLREEAKLKVPDLTKDIESQKSRVKSASDLSRDSSNDAYYATQEAYKSPGTNTEAAKQKIQASNKSMFENSAKESSEADALKAKKKELSNTKYETLPPDQKIRKDILESSARGATRGATLGIVDPDIGNRTKIGKNFGTGADVVTSIGTALLTGGPVAGLTTKALTKTGINYGTKQMVARGTANLATSGTRNFNDALSGRKTFKDALIDTGLGVTSSALSAIPEHVIKQGVMNIIGQYGTDIGLEVLWDVGSGRLDPRKLGDKEFLIKYASEKAINNAAGIGFGIKDNVKKFTSAEQHQTKMDDWNNSFAPANQAVKDMLDSSKLRAVAPGTDAGLVKKEELNPIAKEGESKKNINETTVSTPNNADNTITLHPAIDNPQNPAYINNKGTGTAEEFGLKKAKPVEGADEFLNDDVFKRAESLPKAKAGIVDQEVKDRFGEPRITFSEIAKLTSTPQKIKSLPIPEEGKNRIFNRVYTEAGGVGNKRLYKAVGGEKLPQFFFDLGDFGIVAALHDAGATKVKYEILDALGDAAQESGLKRTDVFLLGGEEFSVVAPKAESEEAVARFIRKLEVMNQKGWDLPVEDADVFKIKLEKKGHRGALKLSLTTNPDGSEHVSDMWFNGAYGKDHKEADQLTGRAKNSGSRKLILQAKGSPNYDAEFKKKFEFETTKHDILVSNKDLSELESAALLVDPEIVKLLAGADETTKRKVYTAITHDDTDILWNRDVYDKRGAENLTQFYVDSPILKPANDVVDHEAGDSLIYGIFRRYRNVITEELKEAIDGKSKLYRIKRRPDDSGSRSEDIPQIQKSENNGTVPGTIPQGRIRNIIDEQGREGGGRPDSAQTSSSGGKRVENPNAGLLSEPRSNPRGISESVDLVSKYFDIYRDRSLKVMVVPKSDAIEILDTEAFKDLLHEAVRKIEFDKKLPEINKQKKKIDLNLTKKQLNDYITKLGFDSRTKNLAELPEANLKHILELYNVKSEDPNNKRDFALSVAQTLKAENAFVYMDHDGSLVFTGFPIEIGYGPNLKTANEERKKSVSDRRKKNLELNKKKIEPPTTPDDDIFLKPPEDFKIALRNSMEEDQSKRDEYIAESFGTRQDIPKVEDFENISAWTKAVGDGWVEQMKREAKERAQANKDKNKKASAPFRNSDDLGNHIIKTMDRAASRVLTPPSSFWFMGKNGSDLINKWLGSLSVAFHRSGIFQKRLDMDIAAAVKDVDDALKNSPQYQKMWKFERDHSKRELLAGMAIHLYRDTMRKPNADEIVVRNWDKMPSSMRLVTLIAKNLTPRMKEIASRFDKYYADFRAIGNKAGMNIKEVENYANRFYKWDDTPKERLMKSMSMKTESNHEKARKLESMLDIYTHNGRLDLVGSSQALRAYMDEIQEVVLNRMFIKLGRTLVDPDSKRPVFVTGKEQPPKGYQRINTQNFKVGLDNLYAPKNVAEHIDNIFRPSAWRTLPVVSSILKLNWIIKNNILTKSLFHFINLTTGYVFGSPYPFSKTAPWKASKWGHELAETMAPVIELGLANGLEIGTYKNIGHEAVRMQANNASQRTVRHEIDQYNLFTKYGDGLKMASYYGHFNRILKNHPDIDTNEAARRAAEIANDDFGGINYKRIPWMSKNFQDFLSLVLFAPDWQLGNMSSFFKSFVNKDDVGKLRVLSEFSEEYRKFWTSAVIKITVTASLLNMVFNDGLTTFENEDPRADKNHGFFNTIRKAGIIDLTNIYRGVTGDNNTKDRYYYNLFMWMGEGLDLIEDPAKFFKNKGSYVSRMWSTFQTGKDWRGRPFTGKKELAKTLKIVKDSSYHSPEEHFWDQAPSMALYMVQSGLPIPVAAAFGYLDGTLAGMETLGNMTGVKVRRVQPNPFEPKAYRNAVRAEKNIERNIKKEERKERQEARRDPERPPLIELLFPSLVESRKDFKREARKEEIQKRIYKEKLNRLKRAGGG